MGHVMRAKKVSSFPGLSCRLCHRSKWTVRAVGEPCINQAIDNKLRMVKEDLPKLRLKNQKKKNAENDDFDSLIFAVTQEVT